MKTQTGDTPSAATVGSTPLRPFASAVTLVVSCSGRERGMADKKAKVASATAGKGVSTASQLIDAKIAELGDWRGETLARIRHIIREADLDVVEEVKWRKPSNLAGVPVWSHAGILCTGETYKDKVKLTFAKGALLDDPSGIFNSSLDGNMRRAIDIGEDAQIDAIALKSLIRAAVAMNTIGRRRPVSITC
jgi:hypothetical protein